MDDDPKVRAAAAGQGDRPNEQSGNRSDSRSDNRSIRSGRRTWIWYGPFARFSDWRQAGRDAKVALPQVQPDGDAVTQHLVMLERRARVAAGRVREAYEDRSASYRVGLAGKTSERDAIAVDRARHEERLTDLRRPMSDAELTERHHGDEAIPEPLVRERRRRERDVQIERVAGAIGRADAQLRVLDADIERLRATVGTLLDQARARMNRIAEHARRRAAAYWRRLVRLHPDGGHINALLKPDWPGESGWFDLEDPRS